MNRAYELTHHHYYIHAVLCAPHPGSCEPSVLQVCCRSPKRATITPGPSGGEPSSRQPTEERTMGTDWRAPRPLPYHVGRCSVCLIMQASVMEILLFVL